MQKNDIVKINGRDQYGNTYRDEVGVVVDVEPRDMDDSRGNIYIMVELLLRATPTDAAGAKYLLFYVHEVEVIGHVES